MGWLILGGAFAGLVVLSAWLSSRWGRGVHSEMSPYLEGMAHDRWPAGH